MTRRRHPLAWTVVLWTTAVIIVAVVMAVVALVSFNAADQRCFMDYPSAPCPGPDDPALTWLRIAFFGMPAVWLVGVLVAIVYQIRRASEKPAP